MIPGPNIVIECPHCGARECYRTLASGNTFRARLYSDGKFIAPMLPRPPAVACCHACQRCYWLDLAKEEGELPRGQGSDFVAEPTASQYHAAMAELIAAAPERELALRIATWQRENDPHRPINDGEHAPASPPAAGESSPTLRAANMRQIVRSLDLTAPHNRLMCADIHRQLGEFEKVRAILEPLVGGEYERHAGAIAGAAHAGTVDVIRLVTTEESQAVLEKVHRNLKPSAMPEWLRESLDAIKHGRRPETKFEVGQRVRIVGLSQLKERNGLVVTLIEGPEWFEVPAEEFLTGHTATRPLPHWIYRTDLGGERDWVGQNNLERVDE